MLSIHGQKIDATKVIIWKDRVWRALCLIEGRRVEVSYPAEFGPKFLWFVENSIYNAHRAMVVLRGDS